MSVDGSLVPAVGFPGRRRSCREGQAGAIRAAIARATGRAYQIDLAALDLDSLREFLRLLRDVEHEKQLAAQQARMLPWRRP